MFFVLLYDVVNTKPGIINVNEYKLTSKLTVVSLHCATVLNNVKIRNQRILFESIQNLNSKNLTHHVYKSTWLNENLMVFDHEEVHPETKI